MNFVPYNSSIARREPVSYRLLPMDRETAEQAAQLEAMCFSHPWTLEMLEDELENPLSSFIVAYGSNDLVLGYAGLTVVAGEGYINNIAVRQEYRRQGVASALLGVFLRFAEAQGLAFLTLEVRPSNIAAKNLYMKHGFAQVGRRKNYYDDPKEDALIMTRTFGAAEEADAE